MTWHLGTAVGYADTPAGTTLPAGFSGAIPGQALGVPLLRR